MMDFTDFDMSDEMLPDIQQYDEVLSSDINDSESFSMNDPLCSDQISFGMPDTDNILAEEHDTHVSFKGYLEELQEELNPFRDDISFKGYGRSGRLELSDRLDHINDIYDGQIERAYDKLADDMERISKDGPYAWENPDATIRADRNSIESLEHAKREAIGQARVDQSKQDYWDSVSDYCDAVFSQKIHGK